MRPKQVCAVALGCVLGALLWARPGAAAVTNPAPGQVFATGTTSMEVGWDPVAGADTYEVELLFNEAPFDFKTGIVDTARTLANVYPPGYYTVRVRGVSAGGAGPWSEPVMCIVRRAMSPDGNPLLKTRPAALQWTRSKAASRYRLKVAQYDQTTGTFIAKHKTWIPQPTAGMPRWSPPDNVIRAGRFRWSVTDYFGETPGYTSTAYFRVKLPPADYLVIDLSGGPAASRYPVAFLAGAPAGGWADAYKTSSLVLRRIPAGTFTMGSPTNELGRYDDETRHRVTLTRGFFIGVFEVTQRQWELVMGNRPSYFNNSWYYASRPVEQISYCDIREKPFNADDPAVNWPANSAVNAASFMGRLRAKTGLATLDLPTEAQWEYACRAGSAKALNSGRNLTGTEYCPNMDDVGRYWFNGSGYWQNGDPGGGTATVGSYGPNAWGLYDMHGNVWEWCLDWYGAYPGAASDPAGAASGACRVLRGGCWIVGAKLCRSAIRNSSWADSRYYFNIGFRAAMPLP